MYIFSVEPFVIYVINVQLYLSIFLNILVFLLEYSNPNPINLNLCMNYFGVGLYKDGGGGGAKHNI